MMVELNQTSINIPDAWGTSKIGKLFDIKQGKSLSRRKQTGNLRKHFLRTSNVFWGRLDLSKIDEMNFTEEECNRLELQYGDLLVCEGGDIGRTAIWKNELTDCYYQNHLHRLRTKDNTINPFYIMFWLQAGMTQLGIYEGLGNKTTIPNLSRARLSEFDILLPPIPEQKKIAAVLYKIQKAIEVQEKIIESTKELKKATMQHLFTRGLRGEKTKQTEIGEIPESWEVVNVGSYCDKPKYGYTESASKEEIGPRFLRITDITDDGVNWDTVPFCKCSSDDFPKYELKPNDILFARIGATTGKSYIIKNPPQAVYASYLIKLRPLDKVEPLYLYYLFNTDEYWSQIEANKGNNLKGGVSASVLSSLLFPLPDKTEQTEIANSLSAIDQKIQINSIRKGVLQNLFKSMLNGLMTGELRVKDLKIDVGEIEDSRGQKGEEPGGKI